MKKTQERNISLGILCSLCAFLIWGLAPIYWKRISHIATMELLGHRVLWGCLYLLILMFLRSGRGLFDEIKEKGEWSLIFSSILIFANWFLFVWAVNSRHILDASLGYYLTPLLNVITGYLFFSEQMRPGKVIALTSAALGVGLLFYLNSGNPWISLSLTCTFSTYAFFKKKSALSAQSALLVEMFLWTIPVIFYFIYLANLGRLSFLNLGPMDAFYVSLTGVITIAPLWFYNHAIKHLDLGTLGFLQYLAPSLQLIVGVLLFNESFEIERIAAFGLIWLGILIYSLDGILTKRKDAKRIS